MDTDGQKYYCLRIGIKDLLFKIKSVSIRVHVMKETVANPFSEFSLVNVAGTECLARMAAINGVKRFVYVSSVKVNGEGCEKPFSEHSLMYVENLVDAIVTCVTHHKAAGQTSLVSDGEDVSTPELIRRVAAALGRPARLLPFPPSLMRFDGKIFGKSDAVERLVSSLTIDNSKIRREMGWKPPYTMEQGLKETAEWYLRVNGKMRSWEGDIRIESDINEMYI